MRSSLFLVLLAALPSFPLMGEVVQWSVGPSGRNGPPGTLELRIAMPATGASTGAIRAAGDLEGLPADLSALVRVPVRFHVDGDAGSFACEGTVHQSRGDGTCEFTPSPAFAGEMLRFGVPRPTREEQIRMAVHGVSLAEVEGLQKLGYRGLTPRRLIDLRIFRVTPHFIRELRDLGYEDVPLEQVIDLAMFGVTARYIRDVAADGRAGRSLEEIIELRREGVAPAPGTSPLSLLAVPADPIVYYASTRRVRELMGSGLYAEAEPLAQAAAQAYPRDGANWIALGHIKARLGKHIEAAKAFETAGPLLGWGLWYNPRIYAAVNYLAAGQKETALELLRTEILDNRNLLRTRLYDWPEFESLREDPEFLFLVGRPVGTSSSRVQRWREDLQFLVDEVKRTNPDYHDRPLPSRFTQRYETLRADIEHLNDAEIFVRMQHLLAALRQGHVSFFETGPGFRQMPLQLYAFPEGIFIVDAAQKDLIGGRVLTIDGTAAEEALRRISETLSIDGDMQYLSTGVHWLVHAQYLYGLGIAKSVDEVTLRVQQPGGVRELTLATVPATSWQKLPAPPGVEPPLFLRRVAERSSEQALPDHEALYVQLNRISNSKTETLPEYGRRLWGIISAQQPKHLILDVRHNSGGDTSLYPELMQTLLAFMRMPDAKLYVILGRGTYSATANLITDLERLASPTFAGEASSECCNFHGDPSTVTLPNSKLQVELTTVHWNLSRNAFDERREMSPHVPVVLTARDYFAGRDTVMETLLELIAFR